MKNNTTKQTPENFYKPKYWPFWLIIGVLRLLVFLPYRTQLWLGKWIGLALYQWSKKLRHIAEVNIDLCFPELSDKEKQTLIRENFISSGMAIFETALAWWGSERKLRSLVHIHGLENLEKAQATGKGVLLLGIHFTTLELAGRLFTLDHETSVMYRGHKIPFINFLIERTRKKHYKQIIERNNIRSFFKALKKGKMVWYTPDIEAGYYDHIFAPFFKIPAATLTATARIPALTGAVTVMSSYYRRDDGTGYDIIFSPMIENFPSDNLEQDISRINELIENAIRKKPEQYLWQYKRFKTRPNNEPRFY